MGRGVSRKRQASQQWKAYLCKKGQHKLRANQMALVQPWRVHEYTGCGGWAQAADERRQHLRTCDTWQACLTQRSLVPWGGLGSQTVWGNDGLGKQKTSGTWKWTSYTHTPCPAVKTRNVLSDPSHPQQQSKAALSFLLVPSPFTWCHFPDTLLFSCSTQFWHGGHRGLGEIPPHLQKTYPFLSSNST